MLIWLLILVLALAISIFLTARSMRGTHFDQTPKENQALFLIRNSQALNSELLTKLHQFSFERNFTFSLERLFKGPESALVIYGSRELEGLLPELGLLELEDYLLS